MSASTTAPDGGNVQTFHDVWEAIHHMTDGARVTVRHDSTRSDSILEKSGRVSHVVVPSGAQKEYSEVDYDARFDFVRDDGQRMFVYDDGRLETAMSQHPFVGNVVEIQVENGITNPVRAPEPVTDPMDVAMLVADRVMKEHPSKQPVDQLLMVADRLKDRGIVPKDDLPGDGFARVTEYLTGEETGDESDDEDDDLPDDMALFKD